MEAGAQEAGSAFDLGLAGFGFGVLGFGVVGFGVLGFLGFGRLSSCCSFGWLEDFWQFAGFPAFPSETSELVENWRVPWARGKP